LNNQNRILQLAWLKFSPTGLRLVALRSHVANLAEFQPSASPEPDIGELTLLTIKRQEFEF
jgi:hypothetical protein